MRILVVEDSTRLHQTVSTWLRRHGTPEAPLICNLTLPNGHTGLGLALARGFAQSLGCQQSL